MKPHLNILPKQLGLPGKLRDNESWFDSLAEFMLKTSDLIAERVKDDGLEEYGERLVIAIDDLSKYAYLVRRERDQALAKGYEKYPKPQYNSDAAEALARQFASEEVRLRARVDELYEALRLRFELNRSSISTARERMKNG